MVSALTELALQAHKSKEPRTLRFSASFSAGRTGLEPAASGVTDERGEGPGAPLPGNPDPGEGVSTLGIAVSTGPCLLLVSQTDRALSALRRARAALDRGAVAEGRALLIDAERLLEGEAESGADTG